jgi:hypothetical protein
MLTYILNAESSLFLTGILNPPVNINKYIKGHIPFTLMFSENQIIVVVSPELSSVGRDNALYMQGVGVRTSVIPFIYL